MNHPIRLNWIATALLAFVCMASCSNQQTDLAQRVEGKPNVTEAHSVHRLTWQWSPDSIKRYEYVVNGIPIQPDQLLSGEDYDRSAVAEVIAVLSDQRNLSELIVVVPAFGYSYLPDDGSFYLEHRGDPVRIPFLSSPECHRMFREFVLEQRISVTFIWEEAGGTQRRELITE